MKGVQSLRPTTGLKGERRRISLGDFEPWGSLRYRCPESGLLEGRLVTHSEPEMDE